MVGSNVSGDLALPLVAVQEKLLLVVEQFFVCFRREFEVGAFDNRVNGTGFL